VHAEVSQLAVIRARLPYVDRRALSQAWFSALHLAADATMPPHGGARRLATAVAGGVASGPRGGKPVAPSAKMPAVRESRVDARRLNPGGDVRTNAGLRSRERRGRDQSGRAGAENVHASFTATLRHSRVRVAIRQEGARLHVVAVCSTRDAAAVRRALAVAAVALRMNGIGTSTAVRIGTAS
jgi:hypothetical protein